MPPALNAPSVTPDGTLLAFSDPDQQAQWALFRALVVTVRHFFGGFDPLFQALTDPREPSRITYSLPSLLATGVLLFIFCQFTPDNDSSANSVKARLQVWLHPKVELAPIQYLIK
ncbi:MAG: hypothetical protein RBT75_18095 [Anaerolineae bacterium]|jgi:hypothetical protein|nr:hypothetical protein [Anaerolineae bacterium]